MVSFHASYIEVQKTTTYQKDTNGETKPQKLGRDFVLSDIQRVYAKKLWLLLPLLFLSRALPSYIFLRCPARCRRENERRKEKGSERKIVVLTTEVDRGREREAWKKEGDEDGDVETFAATETKVEEAGKMEKEKRTKKRIRQRSKRRKRRAWRSGGRTARLMRSRVTENCRPSDFIGRSQPSPAFAVWTIHVP